MTRKWWHRPVKRAAPKSTYQKAPTKYLLDRFTLVDVQRWERLKDQVLEFHWDYYSCVSRQRAKILDELKNSLLENATPFCFKGWVRIVGFKYSMHPLSARGSIIEDPGGRFNIGDIDEIRFPKFSALYLAEDYATAFKGKYQLYDGQEKDGLSANDLALAGKNSNSAVCVRGELEEVLNVNKRSSLNYFVTLTKGFRLPKEFKRRAKRLGQAIPGIIQTAAQLQDYLLDPNWREFPQEVGIPGNSQTISQIAHAAGIQGILYKSKTSSKNCLAIFPQNFHDSSAFVELEDKCPNGLKNNCLNCSTWPNFI